MTFLTGLGSDIEIRIRKPKRAAGLDVVLLVAPAEQILEMVARTGNLTAEHKRHR